MYIIQVRPSAQGGDKASKKQSADSDDDMRKAMTVDAAGNIAVPVPAVSAVSPATSSSRAAGDVREDEWHKWRSALPVSAPEV
jgi:hypothetical protein